MIQKRLGVFETNSSSTHAICIKNEAPEVIPNAITFFPGEYGWEIDNLQTIEERASYFYTAALELKCEDTVIKGIQNALEPMGIECKFRKLDSEWCPYGYIDHAGELFDFVNDLLSDSSLLVSFLFNGDSFVLTGNDNIEDDDDSTWYRLDEAMKSMDKNKFIIYEKGN